MIGLTDRLDPGPRPRPGHTSCNLTLLSLLVGFNLSTTKEIIRQILSAAEFSAKYPDISLAVGQAGLTIPFFNINCLQKVDRLLWLVSPLMSKYESDIWRNNIINTMPGPRWLVLLGNKIRHFNNN